MKIINGLSKAYDILNKTQKKYLIIIFFILIFTMLLEVFSLALIIPVSEAFFNEQNNIIINFKNFLNNFLSFTTNYDFLTILVIFIIVFFIFKFFALIIMTIIQSKIIFKIFTEISERLLTKYLSLDLINYNKKTSGELTRNINSEPAVFISQFSINFVVLIKELLIFFGVIFFLLINSSSFTIFIISIALVFSLMFIFLTSNFQVKLAKNRFSNDGKRLSSIIQIINGFKIIKIFQLKDFFLKEFIDLNKSMSRIGVWQNFVKSFPKFYVELLMVFTLISMFIFFKKNETQYLDIITSISLILASSLRLMPVIKNINVSYAGILSALPSVNLIHHDLNFSSSSQSNLDINEIDKLNLNNKINLKGDKFKYQNTDRILLNKIDIEIKKNEAVGIVGQSGAGKTTIINLILGLINSSQIKLFVDDVEVNSSNVFSWQKKIGLIPQETFLANTSIINNICLGIPENNIDFDKLNSVIEDVRLNDLINEKNNGIREIVGENGKNLSGGQKQKISLARALYFDREILIFDEPSSALDALNQSEVHKTIDSMIGKKTIILISHKIELLNNFHKIYLIHDKKVSLK